MAVTGPRQAGKTTLARAAFPEHAYASLENPAQREFADTDPAGFLGTFHAGVILDEAATPTADALRGLDRWRDLAGPSGPRPCLVYGGDTVQRRSDCDILPWRML